MSNQIPELLRQLSLKYRPSDIHFRAGQSPKVRVDGVIVECGSIDQEVRIVEAAELSEFLSSIVSDQKYQDFLSGNEIDGAFCTLDDRWRLHAFLCEAGIGLALRRLPQQVASLESLGLPVVVREAIKLRTGLILVVGATGSGKTTTAAAIVNAIGAEKRCHIVTIEDPIEYRITSPVSLITQREISRHSTSFAQALRGALREDPDIIFIGEMRDLETVSLALQAAETGHLVISTLHTAGAARAISRIVDVFPSADQPLVRTVLAETLEMVIAQELVTIDAGGRELVPEILVGTPSVRALIREGRFHQLEHVMQTSRGCGMQTRAAKGRPWS